jgi:hypothetical protein
MTGTHDPYLNTVKRSLAEKKDKLRKNKIKDEKNLKEEPLSFLSKNIIISDYIYLPESLQKLFLLTIFVLLPYMLGIFVMFIFMGSEEFHDVTTLTFDLYMLTWTVGYETIAFILLLLIIKSALTFNKK